VTALAGGGNQLTGAYEVHARHTGSSSRPDTFDGYAMASSASDGSYVFYDAGLGVLRCFIGAIDILDASGGRTGGIDPRYSGDPIRYGHWEVTELPLQGWDGETWVFGPGRAFIMDSQGGFDLDATFPAFTYGDALAPPMTGLAPFAELDVKDVASRDSSLFLADFMAGNMLWPADSTRVIEGIALGISTMGDLAQLTANFTRSAQVPATVVLALLSEGVDSSVGDPATGAPNAAGGPLLLDAFPNPSSAGCTIRFALPASGFYQLRILNAAGRLIRTAPSSRGPAGPNSWFWDGRDEYARQVPNGAYFFEIHATGARQVRKLLVVR
jgi:hypothetical protein